ncbi:hypothetical protein F9U64_11225 [Gracilibacillus oryzae]|uniref:Tetratricopeptide repeat protein n=1 Tax=Gracilibacillus oryzae TaxID=1672701 RepID=A0A7C8GTL4_9BACI|nr:hypothetical protein [Gracilibacillus oryzae]KAB8134703.1 hypothetical protein F9U64_11225 [Gracilibacillus oryzae]
MQEEKEKVIIFPKWKNNLEHEAKKAMEGRDFQTAFSYFQKLTENGVESPEVLTGKLICMMELNMEEEAEELCEQLIAKKDNHYYSYIHIYATLLFQASKYNQVMYLIEDVLEEQVPSQVSGQLHQMYQLSKELQQQVDIQTKQEVLQKLTEAIKEKNDRQQWYMVKRLLYLGSQEDISLLKEMLVNREIHPVVKTAILEYYIDNNLNGRIHIEKFHLEEAIDLHNAEVIPEKFLSGIYKNLEHLQQNDPTSFQMIQFILQRFAYVYTPFLPQEDNYSLFAETLEYYVSQSYQFEVDEVHHLTKIKDQYIKMIGVSETLYGSILEV